MLRFTTLVALAVAAANPAYAAPVKEYGEGDGQRFTYTTELKSNGVIHIAGVVLTSGDRFVLDVSKNGHVDGRFGDVPVEYNVSKRVRDTVAAQLDGGVAVAEATLQK
jgi:hypothetical protein